VGTSRGLQLRHQGFHLSPVVNVGSGQHEPPDATLFDLFFNAAAHRCPGKAGNEMLPDLLAESQLPENPFNDLFLINQLPALLRVNGKDHPIESLCGGLLFPGEGFYTYLGMLLLRRNIHLHFLLRLTGGKQDNEKNEWNDPFWMHR
jgi:hypothetical protein